MIDKAGAQYELAFVVLLEIEAVFGFSRNGNLVIDSILHATAEVQTKGRHRLTAKRLRTGANNITIVINIWNSSMVTSLDFDNWMVAPPKG